MRLFAKFFLCATIVISVALLLSGFLLITSSHESAITREKERAVTQYQFDKFTVQAGLIANLEVIHDGVPQGILRNFASDLNGLTAFFANDQTLLYSELPSNTDFSILDDVTDNVHAQRFQVVGDASYITVCGKITQGNHSIYLLVATDISDVVALREQMTQSFFYVYFVTLLLSMVVILALSAFMTRPIKRMNKAAAEIARGSYSERLPASGGDEIGELSSSFNMMADAVEEKIVELSENARQKEDFVANFAHELKTPLTSVIGYADMIYQKNLSEKKIKEAAWYVLSEGLRLEALSRKLMDLIVLNKQDFVMEETCSDVLLNNILGSIKPMLDEKQVKLTLDTQPFNVLVDYDLIKTLLLNLIDNSAKAGSNSIRIVGEPDGTRYRIRVSDNGSGIPEAEIGRITEAFYMVDKSRSRKQHGAGIGLALAAKIAIIHGYPLEVSSVEGIGTTIEIVLNCVGGDETE